MTLEEFYADVVRRGGDSLPMSTEKVVHAVLVALATHIPSSTGNALAELVPQRLQALLARAHAESEFTSDDFIEDVAERLDIDDDDAERVATAVLTAIRDSIHPRFTVEQVIESLPSDLAHLMHETAP